MDKPESSFSLKPVLVMAVVAVVLLIARLGVFQLLFRITSAQEASLAILIIAAVLWVTELVPLFVTSFVILFLQIVWLLPELRTNEIASSPSDFMSPFFSNIIMLFMGGFVLSSLLHRYKLDHRIASNILDRTRGHPGRLLVAIMVVSAVFSMWMSNTATTAMMFAITLPIIRQIPEDNKFSKALALSIPFACNLGGMGTPIGSPPNAIAIGYLTEAGIEISFARWMLLAIPFVFGLLALLWFTLLQLYPAKGFTFDIESVPTLKMSQMEVLVVYVFVATCLLWLTSKYHGLSTGTTSLALLIFCFGFKLLKTTDFRAMSWDVLFMIGGGLTLGVGLKTSGLADVIIGAVPGDLGFTYVVTAFVILAAVMTTFMSNTATANLIVPLAISLGDGVGILVVSVALMCSSAMALPVSTPPNAIAFGSGMLRSRDMVVSGGIVTVCAILVITVLGKMYWRLLGL